MDNQEMRKQKIAAILLDQEAVFLRPDEPFTWASGIRSPIYCDNRMLLSAPEARAYVVEQLAEVIREEYPEAEILMGTATAGIAPAAMAAQVLGLPMGYVRGAAKDHGRGSRIEGRLEPGQKTVVVEDLISTGGSVIEAAGALRAAGAEVLGVISIFRYGLAEGDRKMAEADLPMVSLCTLEDLLRFAQDDGRIDAKAAAMLRAFRDDPKDESWMTKEG